MSALPKLDFSDIVANKENRQRWREENERIQQEKEAQLKQKEQLRKDREKRRLERQEKRIQEEARLRQENEKKQLDSVAPAQVALVTEPVKETPTQPEIIQNPFKSMNPFVTNQNPVPITNYQQSPYQPNPNQMAQAPTQPSVYVTPVDSDYIRYDRLPIDSNIPTRSPRTILRGSTFSNPQEEYRPSKRVRFDEYSDEFSSEEEQPQPIRSKPPPLKRFKIEPVRDSFSAIQEEPKLLSKPITPPESIHQPQASTFLPSIDGSFLYSYTKPVITNMLWGGALFLVMLARGYLSQAYQSHQESIQFNDRAYKYNPPPDQTAVQTTQPPVSPAQPLPSINYNPASTRSSTFDFVK